jgi:hypothetical protein
MAPRTNVTDADRFAVMKVMYGEGIAFVDMIPVLIALGLLECQDGHRSRPGRELGTTVCEGCENNLNQYWRRSLARMGAEELDRDEVKGAWLHDHVLIAEECIRRRVQHVVTETTHTALDADGKEVVTTTVKRETKINIGAMRLLSEVRTKIARLSGLDVEDLDVVDAETQRSKVNVRRHGDSGNGSGERPVN